MKMNWEEDRKRGQGVSEGEYHWVLAQRLKAASRGNNIPQPFRKRTYNDASTPRSSLNLSDGYLMACRTHESGQP